MTNLPGNKKSVSVPVWSILALIALYAGYCMGKIGKASPATFTEHSAAELNARKYAENR